MQLSVPDPNDEDDLCTVIIAIMQKDPRKLNHTGVDNHAIGFEVYQVGFRPLRAFSN